MKTKVNTFIKDGKPTNHWVWRVFKSFEGKNITITIERKKKSRSNPQNNYYWGVVIPIIQKGLYDATGGVWGSNKIHYELLLPKCGIIKETVNINTGGVIESKKSSSELTTLEFSDYIDNITKFASEFLNVEIPNPNENLPLYGD